MFYTDEGKIWHGIDIGRLLQTNMVDSSMYGWGVGCMDGVLDHKNCEFYDIWEYSPIGAYPLVRLRRNATEVSSSTYHFELIESLAL